MNRRGFLATTGAAIFAWQLKHLVTDEHFVELCPPNRAPSFTFILNAQLNEVEKLLPHGIKFFEFDGQRVFHYYGASGGLTTTLAAYYVNREHGTASAMEFHYFDTAADVRRQLVAGLTHFEKVNFNGGDMPALVRA